MVRPKSTSSHRAQLVNPSSSYQDLAEEYYHPRHITSRNFDVATESWFAGHGCPIPNHGLVLDLGCGRGSLGRFCAVGAERVVQGDIAISMLTLSPREPSKGRIVCDALSLPFSTGSFSAIAAFLFDPFNQPDFLAEALRVLTSGGVFLGTLPHHRWGATLRRLRGADPNLARFVTRSGMSIDKPSFLMTEGQLRRGFRAAGYKSVEIYDLTLPTDELTVSPDISDVAEAIGLSPYALPVVLVVVARKET